MTQQLDCRYCGTNLGYLKDGSVYEVRPGERHGPFPRVDDQGNPAGKKEIRRPEPAFRLGDKKTVIQKVEDKEKGTVEDKTVEVPMSLTCGGCGQENPIY